MIRRETLNNWRFGLLLLVVLGTMVIEPMVAGPRADNWILDSAFSLLLVATVVAISVRTQRRALFISLGAVTLLATWGYYVMPQRLETPALVVQHLAGIAFLFLIVGIVLRGLFAAQAISLDVILGTLTGYLLLGTAWAMIYSLVHLLSPDAFDINASLADYVSNRHARFSVFTYYSFVTMTTLGFGEMTPVSPAARNLTWLQAVVGQFYIATLVAGIVGIFVSSRSNRSR